MTKIFSIGDEKTVPVGQMITELHTMDFIQYWLSTWKTKTGSYPREIILDESSALIGASVRGFAECAGK